MLRRFANVFLLLTTLPALAQSSKPFTLHVYANLVQIPVLPLNDALEPVTGISPSAFRISLDSGPKFRPTTVHVEGNDPLSIAVLLDDTGAIVPLINEFPQALSKLTANDLTSKDQLNVFVVDCVLVRTKFGLHPDATTFRNAVSGLLQYAPLHSPKQKPSCASQVSLLNSMAAVSQILAEQPGRRVLLVVSSGNHGHTKLNIEEIYRVMAHNGITVFSMGEDDGFASSSPDPQLFELARDNGGVSFTTRQHEVYSDLKTLVHMLRARYILEFHRPDEVEQGFHNINVTVEHRHDVNVIRTAGVSVKNLDKNARADPTTVPSGPSDAVFGKRPPAKH